MPARVLSPKWLLSLLIAASFATQAVVRTDSSGGGTSTGTSTSMSGGTTFAGPAGSVSVQGSPGGAATVTTTTTSATGPGGPQAGPPGSEGSGGGGGGKKGPGGAIGGNIKAVNDILNPEAKDKVAVSVPPPPDPMTFEDLQDILIADSVGSYPGYCACPYSVNSDGFECGVEAAYYKPGGFRIKCYPQNLKGQDYIFYRKNH